MCVAVRVAALCVAVHVAALPFAVRVVALRVALRVAALRVAPFAQVRVLVAHRRKCSLSIRRSHSLCLCQVDTGPR